MVVADLETEVARVERDDCAVPEIAGPALDAPINEGFVGHTARYVAHVGSIARANGSSAALYGLYLATLG